VRRILHIKRDPESTSELPRYQVTDIGRYGEESGWAITSPLMDRQQLGEFLIGERVSFSDVEEALGELDRKGVAQVGAPPRIGPHVARALFDTVCNPLIESLELELALINRGNWTFSFRPRALELIKAHQRYVDTRAWPNLDELLRLEPQLHSTASQHDRAVSELLAAVATLYDVLLANRDFEALCSSLFGEEKIREVGYNAVHEIFGAYPAADYPSLIAQYVINNAGELPNYYASARFWNYHRAELLNALGHQDVRGPYESTRLHGERLARISDEFIAQLKRIRGDLSRRLDVPVFAGEQHTIKV
jgi:hypothetical protein